MKDQNLLNTIDLVSETLHRTSPYRLTSEVVASAFIFLKKYPEKSIEEALMVGLNEWDL